MKEIINLRRWYFSVGLACVAILTLLLSAQLRLPADGYADLDGIARGDVVAQQKIIAADTGLQQGDQVLAINGQSIEQLREWAFTLTNPATPMVIGEPAVYQVVRNGQSIEIAVTPVSLSLSDILLKNITSLLTGLIYSLVGFVVFLRKPKDRPAQVFYLTCIAIGLPMLARGIFPFQPGDLVSQYTFIIFSTIDYFTFWINLPLVLHLLLIFPRRSPILDKVPWLLPVSYPLLAIVSMGAGIVMGDSVASAIDIMDSVRFPIGMAYLILGLISLLYTFVTTQNRTERNQLRWIVWGAVVGTVPWLALVALPQGLFGEGWVSVDFANFFLAIVPVAFGVSIIRYRLFDIETLIHRSVVYGVLSIALAGVYLLLVFLLTQILPLLGLDPSSPALPIAVVLIVAAIFTPSREWLQLLIDRTFYKDRLAFKQLPLQVSRELSGAVQLVAINQLLTKTIPQRLQITSAELLIFDQQQSQWYVQSDSHRRDAEMLVSHSLVDFLQGQDGAVPLYDTDDIDHRVEPLFQRSVEVIVPLNVEQNLVGLYNLYRKASGDYYQTEEVEVLSNLGYQAAISVSNAMKFGQIEQLNTDLQTRAEAYEALYRQERRRATQLSLINDVNREVTSILEINRLLNTVVQLIRDSFDYHWASIALTDAETDPENPELVCVASSGDFPEGQSPVGLRGLLRGPGITTRVARTGTPALLKDVRQDPDFMATEVFADVASELTVPLTTQDGVIGVLDLVSQEVDGFDTDDLITMQTLAGQIGVAIENARLYETQAEQERMKQELRIARNIQTNLLPLRPPIVPGLKIFGKSIAAEEVGGDFFNYVTHSDTRLGVAVGDVSGKGLSGSLFMAVSITALRAQAPHYQSAAALLSSLNDLLYPQLRANKMNAAMQYLQIDLAQNLLQVSNAGLIAPLVISGDSCVEVEVGGLPLGVMAQVDYTETSLALKPGDMIMVCSDGIIEAMNPQNELYGFERLESAICHERQAGSDAEVMVNALLADVTTFMEDAPQHDDMTIVAIELTK